MKRLNTLDQMKQDCKHHQRVFALYRAGEPCEDQYLVMCGKVYNMKTGEVQTIAAHKAAKRPTKQAA